MSRLKTKFSVSLTCLCLLLFSTAVTTKVEAATETKSVFQKARRQLPPDFYALYRIVDRIARANEYDTRPWQIVRVGQYDTQGFGKNPNTIAIFNGILEELASDASALACMISHQMAHHRQRHQVVNAIEKAELIAQIREEAEKEVLGRKRKTSTFAAVGDFVVRRMIGGTIGAVVGGVLDSKSYTRIRNTQRKIDAIVEKKTAQLAENIKQQSRKDEFEADKVAYLASVKAGFDKEGCLRAMSILSRTPGVKFDDNHPTVNERITAIKAVMKKFQNQSLVEEGKQKLFQTQPLTYNFSANQTNLLINSRHGTSVGDDIDRMFGG